LAGPSGALDRARIHRADQQRMAVVSTSDLDPGTTPAAPERAARPRWWRGALVGLLAVAVALAVGELVTGVLAGTSSSVVSVGEVVVENAPAWLKDFAIETFGEDDKPALIAGTTILLVLASIALGIASLRRAWIGIAGTVVFGVVGVGAAITRPGASVSDIWPTVLGTLASIGVWWFFLVRPAPARARSSAHAPGSTVRHNQPDRPDPQLPAVRRPSGAPVGFDRRGFLISAGVVAGGAVVVGAMGRGLQGRHSVSGARAALQLPAPASPAAALPTGVDLGVAGIAPFVTPNADFYRVDTALTVPQVDPYRWRLTIKGMVDRELELSFEDLVNRDLIETDVTLVCVSNEVGGTYAGNARWLGVPLADLLEEAGVQAGADQMVSRSVDDWTAGTPTEAVMDGRDAMVAIGMNGEPLPIDHGFPARLVVPGLYGFVSATKWVTEIELTTFEEFDAYWLRRGWAQKAPIKTMARIDTPKGLAKVGAGTVPIGGVAWAVHRGIEAVEVRVDDGPWQLARLGEVPDSDTWRQWMLPWEATPGRHTITARATDGRGEVQTEDRADPIPDGASGWHSVVVTVP
jgi:DMSO/TMAO reductase YedYZ molybdopterin-dependent catalytic subunit